MALLKVNVEQILDLIQQLPAESKRSVFEALRQNMSEESPNSDMDEESRTWLEADLAGELPEYDWGPEGVPEGIPIVCTDEGIFISEADKVGT
ncbi:MAG: hypothetical protein WA885_02225 [Phormidesmis sp.]